MGVHDEITEEFFADSPVQVSDHFPSQWQIKGAVPRGALCFKGIFK